MDRALRSKWARLPLAAWVGLSLLSAAAPARAIDMVGEQARTCVTSKDANTRLTMCTMAIMSGRFNGRDLALLYYSRGVAYAAKQDREKAAKDFDKAISLYPDFKDAKRARQALASSASPNQPPAPAQARRAKKMPTSLARAISADCRADYTDSGWKVEVFVLRNGDQRDYFSRAIVSRTMSVGEQPVNSGDGAKWRSITFENYPGKGWKLYFDARGSEESRRDLPEITLFGGPAVRHRYEVTTAYGNREVVSYRDGLELSAALLGKLWGSYLTIRYGVLDANGAFAADTRYPAITTDALGVVALSAYATLKDAKDAAASGRCTGRQA